MCSSGIISQPMALGCPFRRERRFRLSSFFQAALRTVRSTSSKLYYAKAQVHGLCLLSLAKLLSDQAKAPDATRPPSDQPDGPDCVLVVYALRSHVEAC